MWRPCYLDLILFPEYPRIFHFVLPGKRRARRRLIHRPHYLADAIAPYDGVAHIYTELYRLPTVSKAVLDIDAESLRDALDWALAVLRVLEREGVPYVWLFSGRKGFHIYILTRPYSHPDRRTLSLVVRSVQDYYAASAGVRVDRHLVGSLDHMIRYPNTIHPASGRRAVYLPPLGAWKPSLPRILELSAAPQCPDYTRVLEREPRDPREYVNLAPHPLPEPEARPSLPSGGVARAVARMLRDLVRPCVYRYALKRDPDHFIRTQLALELCWLGYEPGEIVSIIERLGWEDYDRRVTEYHVNKICEKAREGRLYPASCRTIRARGYCLGRECPYYPGVFYWWPYLFGGKDGGAGESGG